MLALGVSAALFAAAFQTVAHAVLKAANDKLAVRTITGLMEAIVMLPFCFVVPPPTAPVFGWLLASAVLHVLYQLTLTLAYKATDFSVAYPLARGIVPIGTTVLGIALLGDELSALAAAGILIISSGLLLSASTIQLGWLGLGTAIGAGVLTTCYSLVDASGIRLAAEPLTFIVWFFVLDGVGIISVSLALARRDLCDRLWSARRAGSVSGVLSLAGYSASLTAFNLLPLGAASALHITSVMFSAVVARFALGEKVGWRRASASGLIAGGAVLVIAGLG